MDRRRCNDVPQLVDSTLCPKGFGSSDARDNSAVSNWLVLDWARRDRRWRSVGEEMRIGAIGDGASSPCPSMEQLMGIVDATDPCQAASILSTSNLNSAPASETIAQLPSSTGGISTTTAAIVIAAMVGLILIVKR